MTTFGQLLAAISIPTLVALIGVLLNQTSYRELRNELTAFRLEMSEKLGLINTRLAVIETRLAAVENKVGIIPPQPKEKDAA